MLDFLFLNPLFPPSRLILQIGLLEAESQDTDWSRRKSGFSSTLNSSFLASLLKLWKTTNVSLSQVCSYAFQVTFVITRNQPLVGLTLVTFCLEKLKAWILRCLRSYLLRCSPCYTRCFQIRTNLKYVKEVMIFY